MSNKEKRKRNRVDFIISAKLTAEDGNKYSPQVQNISMDGLYVSLDEIIPVGTSGKVKILLVFGESKLKVNAEFNVVRVDESKDKVNKYGIGLHFTSIEPESSITLYNMVKYQTKNSND